MADKKKKISNRTYQDNDVFIKKWTRVMLLILFSGIGGGLLLMVLGTIIYGNVSIDEFPFWVPSAVLGLMSAGLVVPLLLGAILGGLAIHRFAWIPMLLVVSGLLAVGVSRIDHFGFLLFYGVTAMVVGVISAFIIAVAFTNVPIWLQFPIIGSPRLYLRGKNKKK